MIEEKLKNSIKRIAQNVVERYYGLHSFGFGWSGDPSPFYYASMRGVLLVNGRRVTFKGRDDCISISVKCRKSYYEEDGRGILGDRDFLYAHPNFLDDLDSWMRELGIGKRGESVRTTLDD